MKIRKKSGDRMIHEISVVASLRHQSFRKLLEVYGKEKRGKVRIQSGSMQEKGRIEKLNVRKRIASPTIL